MIPLPLPLSLSLSPLLLFLSARREKRRGGNLVGRPLGFALRRMRADLGRSRVGERERRGRTREKAGNRERRRRRNVS